jgi:hypothetical protein
MSLHVYYSFIRKGLSSKTVYFLCVIKIESCYEFPYHSLNGMFCSVLNVECFIVITILM